MSSRSRILVSIFFLAPPPRLSHAQPHSCPTSPPWGLSQPARDKPQLVFSYFELVYVFVFRLGGPPPSEAAGGRPLTERSKRDGLVMNGEWGE